MRRPVIAAAILAVLATPARAADLGVVLPNGTERPLTAEALSGLPTVEVVTGDAAHGQPHRFEGPTLWTVLDHAGAVDPAQFRGQVRQYVLLTGRDGYTALIALGEIAPEFEGKPVIVAERMDGRPLGPEHRRIVVPGDKRGGRGVRDLVGITVTALPR